MKNFKKKTLLVGEGIHQHTLYGDFDLNTEKENFADVLVKEESDLKHEKPNGSWSNEHKTLKVEKGKWVMGRQVEYSPFSRSVGQVWD